MKEDKAKLLVAALRSGEYTQTGGKLRTKFGFCCLGVACDLYQKEVGGIWDGSKFTVTDSDSNWAYLPDAVKEWFGCENNNPKFVNEDGIVNHPANMNDEGKTFAEIANFIEANWEGLK